MQEKQYELKQSKQSEIRSENPAAELNPIGKEMYYRVVLPKPL